MADISKNKSDKKDNREKSQKTNCMVALSLTKRYPLYESYYRTGLRLVGEVVSLCVAEIERKATIEHSHII